MGKTMKHFTGWLQLDVDYYKWLSRDGVSQDAYGASSSVNCYIVGSTQIVRNARQEEITSLQQLYIDGEDSIAAGITEDDKFYVSGKDRPVQALGPFYDESGTLDYLVVYL